MASNVALVGVAGRDCYAAVKGGIAAISCSMAVEFADLQPRTLPPAARQVKSRGSNDVLCQLAALRCGFYSEVNFFTPPVLQTSSESGRRSFHSAITPGC